MKKFDDEWRILDILVVLAVIGSMIMSMFVDGDYVRMSWQGWGLVVYILYRKECIESEKFFKKLSLIIEKYFKENPTIREE